MGPLSAATAPPGRRSAKASAAQASEARRRRAARRRRRRYAISPRQGYRVAPVSVADARDLFRMRSVLEAASVMEGARAAADEDLEALDRFRRFREKGARGGFLAYNREFHCALARLSGN